MLACVLMVLSDSTVAGASALSSIKRAAGEPCARQHLQACLSVVSQPSAHVNHSCAKPFLCVHMGCLVFAPVLSLNICHQGHACWHSHLFLSMFLALSNKE